MMFVYNRTVPYDTCCMQDGDTALILAASNGHSSMVTLLVEKGADITAKSKVSIRDEMICKHYSDGLDLEWNDSIGSGP